MKLSYWTDKQIKAHVRRHYTRLFTGRDRCRVPVQRGKELAEALGYPQALLKRLPAEWWENFLPCGNPLTCLECPPGAVALNLGSGVGIDGCALWLQSGGSVTVFNVDVAFAAVRRARQLAAQVDMPQEQVRFLCADGEKLPFAPGIFDTVLMNGVFNLFPQKECLLREVARVMKAGGSLVVVDLCRTEALPHYFDREPDAWAWCMSGSCSAEELRELLQDGGFQWLRLDVQEKGEWFHRVALVCSKNAPRLAN